MSTVEKLLIARAPTAYLISNIDRECYEGYCYSKLHPEVLADRILNKKKPDDVAKNAELLRALTTLQIYNDEHDEGRYSTAELLSLIAPEFYAALFYGIEQREDKFLEADPGLKGYWEMEGSYGNCKKWRTAWRRGFRRLGGFDERNGRFKKREGEFRRDPIYDYVSFSCWIRHGSDSASSRKALFSQMGIPGYCEGFENINASEVDSAACVRRANALGALLAEGRGSARSLCGAVTNAYPWLDVPTCKLIRELLIGLEAESNRGMRKAFQCRPLRIARRRVRHFKHRLGWMCFRGEWIRPNESVALIVRNPADPRFALGDISNSSDFLGKLMRSADPICSRLRELVSQRSAPHSGDASELEGDQTDEEFDVLSFLNHLVMGPLIWEKDAFRHVKLRKRTRRLLLSKPSKTRMLFLNRLLLEDAFAGQLPRYDAVGASD